MVAVLLTFCVMVFGAFVRLSDAGLSCPDWPTCYGRASWPQAMAEAKDHVASEIRPFETHKAWREQAHRMLAGTLGVLVWLLAMIAARKRRWGIAQILIASGMVAIAIPLYMRGEHQAAAILAALAESMLLFAALRWSNVDLSRVTTLTLAMIIFQALLGMWTVTWLLKPIVVMGHLLGGMTTFALLVWVAWRALDRPIRLVEANQLRHWVIGGLMLLIMQIALGGWVSANYAALSCGAGSWSAHIYSATDDFPRCVGQWWPKADFREGFVLWRGVGTDYEGGVLGGASRIAIQLTHRIGAVIVGLYLLSFGLRLLRSAGMWGWGVCLMLMVLTQIALGILNVKLTLPLSIAVAHNAGAAILLFMLVTLLARLRKPD